jgi:parallel beta-helix repeat protein
MKTILLLLGLLLLWAFPSFAAHPPTPITACGTITQSGSYVLQNDLLLNTGNAGYGSGGNCLTIAASRAHVNLNGHTIEAVSMFPALDGVSGGIGVDIEADNVTVSNGSVSNFVYGVSGNSVKCAVVTDVSLRVVTGLMLTNVSRSTFKRINYSAADLSGVGAFDGPVAYVVGGGSNTFNALTGSVFSDPGIGPDGFDIDGSNRNVISGLNIQGVPGANALILFGGSSYNTVMGNTFFDEGGHGIVIDAGSGHNFVSDNNVTIASSQGVFAMVDMNPNCGSNVWLANMFSNQFISGDSADPVGCIR